jgi:acyl-CoA synthetase (AMP-forming)/AMP-acid ligase II
MNVANLLVASARSFGTAPALARGSTVCLSYEALVLRAAKLATSLSAAFGGAHGGRVAVVARNGPEYMEVMWAAWLAGLCIVPVNAKLHPREIAYVFDHAGVKICFASSELADAIGRVAADVATLERAIFFGSKDYAALFDAPPMPVQDVGPDAPAWLFYTSGTTGRPKGATLTHRNLLGMTLRYFPDIDSLSAADSIVHVAPFSHATGLFSLAHVAKASRHVFPEAPTFDEVELAALVNAHEQATIFLAPTMLNRFVAHAATTSVQVEVERVRTIIYGGAPMYLEDLKRALRFFGPRLCQLYGQGETPNTITFVSKAMHADSAHPRYEERLASVGIARTGIDVQVADADGRPLAAGEIGEVLVRSDVTMAGYWNDEAASAKALAGGWLHTGDLGTFDREGFLTLKDRSKDVIISGGSNIYPREVEEVLLRHEDVLEVAVVGRPSAQWGEEVFAFVVLKPGSRVSRDELDRCCLENIARFKRPKDYAFVPSLPKNNYGKVLKKELRASFGARAGEG